MLKNYLKLLRPAQWLKNTFIFLPIFFNGRMVDAGAWVQSIIAFAAFSMMASAVYCLNDLCDVKADRAHPVKCHRPLASGSVSIRTAIALMIAAFTLSLVIIALSDAPVYGAGTLLGYAILNVAYSLWLKNIAIVDVFCLSIGFVLRILLGAEVCDIWVSPWMICMTFLLTLFMSFAKRRDDALLMRDNVTQGRPSVRTYNIQFLNMALSMTASVTVVCYICYTLSPNVQQRLGSEYIYVTSPFVIAGILRYMQIAIVEETSGSPTHILIKDRFIHLSIAGWIISFAILLYI